MFKSDRIFSSRNSETGFMDWFFSTREGIYGPFSSKEQATRGLKEIIQHYMETGNDGGRSVPESDRISIMPKEYPEVAKQYDPGKKKKGIESL